MPVVTTGLASSGSSMVGQGSKVTSTYSHVQGVSRTAATAVPAIDCVNLTKTYGSRACVDNLSFSVQAGELYALLGDNGAGKTTTISMLTTLLQPSSGSFSICGFDGISQHEQAKTAFGVVSQEVALYGELTAYENLEFIADLYGMPRAQKRARIMELLEQSGLADRANDPAGRFSMGMQRKLSIAIAILRSPRVIFMDEPTVGLDPASRRQIWDVLAALKKRGVTILLTTHYLEDAQFLADRIGIIRHGRMIMEGTIEELRAQLRTSRTISVGLVQKLSSEQCEKRFCGLLNNSSMTASFDEFKSTITFTPPADASMMPYLTSILDWLQTENIEFEKLSTAEPSLEDIFLSVQASARSMSK
jgi:ABC-2 type transport system ATP-binding protein